jgi:hypothetical protein
MSIAPDVQGLPPGSTDPPGRDAVLAWNAVALQAVAADHTQGSPQQGGPTRSSRALAIVHAAMFDAANSIAGDFTPYATFQPISGASLDAAVAQAAHDTLAELYPAQAPLFAAKLNDFLAPVPRGASRSNGVRLGALVAKQILKDRRNDGSDASVAYVAGTDPGDHQVDPMNPLQGYLGPEWGFVTPFGVEDIVPFMADPPPALGSPEYAAAFDEVKVLGEKNSQVRTDEQTQIGLFWAYDGPKKIGPPPRLYNQIARVIAVQEGNTEMENARLFALINIAMADAGIAAWATKYTHDLWRPIVAIRNAHLDGNADTAQDPLWVPLGAPASNQSGHDFTPPFPAYPSGHATFGAVLFRTLENFYGTDAIAFEFTSDELDGVTTNWDGSSRAPFPTAGFAPRTFTSLGQASAENARSRIYLGVHWQFDADAGITTGNAIADAVFANVLTEN